MSLPDNNINYQTYATVDLNNLRNNIDVIRRLSGSELIAVVKANAYGSGAIEVSRYAYDECSQDSFATVSVGEGVQLRQALGDGAIIYVLGSFDENDIPHAIKYDLILTMHDEHSALMYDSFGLKFDKRLKVSVKVDTGMNRLGFVCKGFDLDVFRKRYRSFDIVHIMSHFVDSDCNGELSRAQMDEFDAFLDRYAGVGVRTSLLNSAGVLNCTNRYTHTRPGVMLHGYGHKDLKRVLSLYSRVVHVKYVPKGKSVGYGASHVCDRDSVIGIVPIGYADGYKRCFAEKSYAYIDGYRCPMVGRVCMDMSFFDVTELPYDALNKEIVLLGDDNDAAVWADWGETIVHEILCGIGCRVARIYLK